MTHKENKCIKVKSGNSIMWIQRTLFYNYNEEK